MYFLSSLPFWLHDISLCNHVSKHLLRSFGSSNIRFSNFHRYLLRRPSIKCGNLVCHSSINLVCICKMYINNNDIRWKISLCTLYNFMFQTTIIPASSLRKYNSDFIMCICLPSLYRFSKYLCYSPS